MPTRQQAGMSMDRREMLFGLGATLGTVALNAMLQAEEKPPAPGPLAPKPPHLPARAKACIFLTMAGGPSHIDTFDPKPKLDELHLKQFKRQDKFASMMASGNRYFVKSPFRFHQVDRSGLHLCEHFEELAKVADELRIYKGCVSAAWTAAANATAAAAARRIARFMAATPRGPAPRPKPACRSARPAPSRRA